MHVGAWSVTSVSIMQSETIEKNCPYRRQVGIRPLTSRLLVKLGPSTLQQINIKNVYL